MLSRRDVIFQAAAAAAMPSAAFAQALSAQIEAFDRPLRVLAPNGSQANLRPVLQSFEAHFGCTTDLITTDVDNINAMLTLEALTGENRVDVALPATFGIPDLAEGGVIRALGPASSEALPREPHVTSLYETGDFFDGQRWGYQTDGDAYLMFYHADMMSDPELTARFEDRFGEALEVAATWPMLDRQMAFFHQPDRGMYGGCLFRTEIYAAWEWWARFHANGVWPFSLQMEPQIDGGAGVAALEAMLDSAAHLVGSDLGLFDNWARYKRGDIFANIGWGGTQKALNAPGSKMRNRVIPGRLPCGQSGQHRVPVAYFNWGWSYVVTQRCPVPDLAHLFTRHAVSPAVSAMAVAQSDGFFDPFRKEHYDAPTIVEAYGRPFLDEHRRAMTAAMPDLYLARRNEYFEELSYWLALALSREVAPDTALRRVADAWRLITTRVGHAAQEKRWQSLRRKYPQELRAHLKDL